MTRDDRLYLPGDPAPLTDAEADLKARLVWKFRGRPIGFYPHNTEVTDREADYLAAIVIDTMRKAER